MELRHLRAFRMVARTGSVTRAAGELHYAQSTVTEQIQALEAELGTRLFEREGRALVLTAAGARLVTYADQVLALVEQARAEVPDAAGQPSGPLAVGALETLCAHRMPAVLARYRELWPRVLVSVREANRGELYGAVRRGELDVSLTFGDPPADERFDSHTLEHQQLMVVAPAGHRFGELPQVRAVDLRGEPFLATERGCGFREMYDHAVAGLGPDGPVLVAEMTSLSALCGCVALGMGAALLPRVAVTGHLDRGEVVAVPHLGPRSRTAVTMTWLRRRAQVPALAAFLDTARSVFDAGGDGTR